MNTEQLANYVLTFVLVSLAVYRCATMVALEYGPFDIFARLRGENPNDPHANFGRRKNVLQKLLSCPHCLGVWFALAGTPFLPYYGVGWFVVNVLALSGVASLLVKKYG